MKTHKLDELLYQFNIQADTVRNKITNLLVTVSNGRIPDEEEMKVFNVDMGALVYYYNQIRKEAENVLSEDEMPKGDSKAVDYVVAVSKSKSRLAKLQTKRAGSILQRFLMVKSLIAEYEEALLPFQEKATEALKELSEENIDQIIQETEGPETFLKALTTENINSPEGFQILGEVNKFFPMQVQWGLAGGQYFIDENGTVEDIEVSCEDVLPLRENEKQIVKQSEEQEAQAQIDKPEEKKEDVSTEHKFESEKKNEVEEEEKITNDTENDAENEQGVVLAAINKVKANSPSASSFKKEIARLAKRNKEIRTVLPLLTNLGTLSKEQFYMFGICMDCFEESDRDREKVDAAVDVLAGKGYLACFELEKDDTKEQVYCLSSYCLGCLKKDSVSVQMRGFWELSFGTTQLQSSSDIDRDIVEVFLRNNDKLVRYLYEIKDIVELDEYRIIKWSIKWNEDHYRVAVVKNGKTICCYLYDTESDPGSIEEEGLLVVGNDSGISEKIKKNGKEVFVFDNHVLTHQGESTDSDSMNVEASEVPGVPVAPEAEDEKDASNRIEVKAKEKEQKIKAGRLTEAVKKTAKDKVGELEQAKEKDKKEETLARTLLDKVVPSDREFATVINQLLNREATTKEQLTSFISQVIAFAKAVGDVATKENGEISDYPESYKLSAQLRLASNLMLNECTYTSEFLSSVFVNPASEDPAIMLSAYMFAMLVPGMAFDYGLRDQTELFLSHYEDYFKDFAAFKPLFNKLMGVRDVTATGFSPAFVALLGDEIESERFINGLRMAARNCLVVRDPKTRMKALPPMYAACFGVGSDLHNCMTIISDNKQDENNVEFVEIVLNEFCDERNGESSLSRSKIEDKLSKAWYDAIPKNKFKLEYDARDQALRQFRIRLEIMLEWVEHIRNMNNRKQDISRLKTMRAEIIKLIQGILKDTTWKKQKSSNILSWALSYMQLYLNGQVVKLKIYAEYLYSGVISVGNDGTPILDHDLARVKYYEPWRNVLTHIFSAKKSVTDVKSEILGDNLDDKADEEGLKDNLHQLEMLGRLLEVEDDDYVITDGQLKDAVESADDRTTRFQEKLELAYTYNQINETEKETILGIMNQYKASFYEVRDFACWRRFLESLEKQVTEFAKGRKARLRARLDVHLERTLDSSLLNEANRLLEQDMNFAVTEEYINRFEAGEIELDDDLILHDVDYFSDFLDAKNFDPLLRECRRCNGKRLSNFGWYYIERNMPSEWTSRQKDDSKNLVTSWPGRKAMASPMQIKTLFTCLGFDVINASRITGKKEEIFKIDVRQTAKSMADYRHPIAAFGTQIKSPINAIMLYGNYTERQLVDTVSSLNLGGISIVLLDRPVDVAGRRLIGEIFHTQTSGQNPFLLIDQVLLLYLALHQITERLPAMLKCTLPYSIYQPFVRDGGSTADEMFCGRTLELATIIDPNGASVVYGGRQLGKTALLERAESRCSKPDNKAFAVYTTIIRIKNEKEVVDTIVSDINKKVDGKFRLAECNTIKDLCGVLGKLFRSKQINSMLLLIDEVDDFLASISGVAYRPIQPLVDLKRETKNNFKFVIAGLHNVCRAKNATRDNGIFGQLGTPLCIKPLSPTDALQLISRPLRYLGFQIDRYPHLETILTNTNYYPGILQFFGYMLVETLTSQYSKYYHAVDGNPPFTLQDEQLGAVMNSSDLNKSIKDKFRWSLELDQRYFMIARCITMLYHYYEDDHKVGGWQGFHVDAIMEMAGEYEIHCLEQETKNDYINLLDEMVEMGIVGKPDEGRPFYRLRRNSFVDIIGENFDVLEADIINNNEEV